VLTRWPFTEDLRQIGELCESILRTRAVGCAPVFGGGGTCRGDCTGRRSTNVAKPVLIRQARNGFREHDP
jgi:hypothetical protein